MYEGIKKALGPTRSKTASVKSTSVAVITDKSKQMDRWVDHFFELYSRMNTVSALALESIEGISTMHMLDNKPSLEELSKAIDSLAAGKVPSNTPATTTKAAQSVLAGRHCTMCRTCGIPELSPSITTRATGMIATTTGASFP